MRPATGAAEGFRIREVAIFPRAREGWGGRCMESGKTWQTGPDSSASDDLRLARFFIAGLAGEAITGKNKPGSSLEEVMVSRLLTHNAVAKLAPSKLSNPDYDAFARKLWHEQVWEATTDILYANEKPFIQLAECLQREKHHIHGRQLEKVLRQVQRTTS